VSQPASATYRDERLGILISVLVLGLALSALVPLPSWELVLELFGSELALRFSGPVQSLVLLVILVCVGVNSLARSSLAAEAGAQQDQRGAGLATGALFWPLPTLVAVLGLVAVQSVVWWGYQLALAFVIGIAMATIIMLQLATQSLYTTRRRGLRLALNGIAYAMAFVLFVLIFGARQRSLLSATAVLAVSSLLALELLRNTETATWRTWLCAASVGLAMGELTWVLNYTRLADRTGGALLLLIFYVVTGLTQQHLWGRLDRRVLAEYVAVLGLGIAVIAVLL
jgi:hypothetical protein